MQLDVNFDCSDNAVQEFLFTKALKAANMQVELLSRIMTQCYCTSVYIDYQNDQDRQALQNGFSIGHAQQSAIIFRKRIKNLLLDEVILPAGQCQVLRYVRNIRRDCEPEAHLFQPPFILPVVSKFVSFLAQGEGSFIPSSVEQSTTWQADSRSAS